MTAVLQNFVVELFAYRLTLAATLQLWAFFEEILFALKIFWGPPTRFVVCASKPWPVSSACKKIQGPALPIWADNIVSRKSPVGWVNICACNFLVCGPKFTIFSPNWGCTVWVKKSPPCDLRFFDIFSQTVKNFKPVFLHTYYAFLSALDYTVLFSYLKF